MSNWLCRWFKIGCPKPPVVRPTVGVVCHRLNDADVAALRAMGVKHVRVSLYANGEGSAVIDRAVAEGFDVLCVTYRSAESRMLDAGIWPTVAWQIGNEPDSTVLDPTQAAALTAGGDVASGIAHGTKQQWINTFLALRWPPSQIPAAHIYGTPLRDAMKPTMAQFPAGTWLTEIGTLDASDLDASLRLIDGAKYPRVYVYALVADDGYTLTPAHQTVLRLFIQGA